MAKIISDNKLFFAIEGLPRSGTTILNSIFNSLEDAFCFSEPIWQLIQDPYGMKLGKLKDKIPHNLITADNIMLELQRVLQTYVNVEIFCRNYRNFVERIHKKAQVTPTYIIKYEDMCSASSIEKYINIIMGGKIEISGELSILRTGYSYGDTAANNSSEVSAARKTTDNLTDIELEKISEIESFYSETGSGRC